MKVRALNSKQFEAMNGNLSQMTGVMLIYAGANDAKTALYLSGDEFTPKNGTQNEAFRVWKNVYTLFRGVKAAEISLRQDNDAIRSKLRAGTPEKVVFVAASGKVTESYDLSASVWKSVGLVPTKKDLDLKGRDLKTAIHKAAEASFKAISMRDLLPMEQTEQTDKVETDKAKAGRETPAPATEKKAA